MITDQGEIVHAFGGLVAIAPSGAISLDGIALKDNNSFFITFFTLPTEACIALLTTRWEGITLEAYPEGLSWDDEEGSDRDTDMLGDFTLLQSINRADVGLSSGLQVNTSSSMISCYEICQVSQSSKVVRNGDFFIILQALKLVRR